MSNRARRETATYRGTSGAYYGFTVFTGDEALPRAAGIYMLVRRAVGPSAWDILLIGETSNFVDELSAARPGALAEARRRGATHQMLYVSAIATDRRREAAVDLWRNIRSPLVAWDSEDILRRA
ncbi:MAG: hypothetical protein OXT06_10030 [Rhodospirillaceae bacterium]|nr:hypothetical protein [Rhodospirillaceae bacterium]